MLDLGTVREIAEVSVNGKRAGVAWKAPYAVDVTDAVKAGANSLTIKVTNLWPNRLIGDAQPGATKQTWTAMDVLAPNDPVAQLGRAWTARVRAPALGPAWSRPPHAGRAMRRTGAGGIS